MKKLMLVLIVLAGMVLVQGCSDKAAEENRKQYQKEIDAANTKIRMEKEVVAEYEILFSVRLLDTGEFLVEILIPSFSRDTSMNELLTVIKDVEQKGYNRVVLYCTKDAYEANMSDKYSKAYPNAMKIGYLGEWRNGSFTVSNYSQDTVKEPAKEWTTTDIYDLQCLQEEIPWLRQAINNKDGKWNAEMVRQLREELQLKEAALRTLYKK